MKNSKPTRVLDDQVESFLAAVSATIDRHQETRGDPLLTWRSLAGLWRLWREVQRRRATTGSSPDAGGKELEDELRLHLIAATDALCPMCEAPGVGVDSTALLTLSHGLRKAYAFPVPTREAIDADASEAVLDAANVVVTRLALRTRQGKPANHRVTKPGELRFRDVAQRVPSSTIDGWVNQGLRLDGAATPTKLRVLRRLRGNERVFDEQEFARFERHHHEWLAAKGPAPHTP